MNWGPKPFRFENCWLLHKDFLPKVRDRWSQLEFHGFTGFTLMKKLQGLTLMKKLQGLKAKIKEWNKISFGSLNDKEMS